MHGQAGTGREAHHAQARGSTPHLGARQDQCVAASASCSWLSRLKAGGRGRRGAGVRAGADGREHVVHRRGQAGDVVRRGKRRYFSTKAATPRSARGPPSSPRC